MRSVPDDREVPRAAQALGARRGACGLTPEPIVVSAETAWRMMTTCDPWVNMLRATIAVFSAGLGAADSISVLPYTAALGLPTALPAHGAQTRNSFCWKNQTSPRSPIPPPAPARLKI